MPDDEEMGIGSDTGEPLVADSKTDELVKPDMRAVLERTHLRQELNDFLLPVFEAVSNAIHGIEAKFGILGPAKGRIHIHFDNPTSPRDVKVSITDNGVGLNADNYSHFRVPFSGHKLQKHGRGFGRFIAFKVFSHVTYTSRFESKPEDAYRSFRFDISVNREFTFLDKWEALPETGVKVVYSQLLPDWHDLIKSLKTSSAADAIGSHFLPQFLYGGGLPKIQISFDDEPPTDITAHFKSIFVEYDKGEFEVEVDGKSEKIVYSLTRIPRTKQFKNHCLLFSAADRIVGNARDLTGKLGPKAFIDKEGNSYVVLAVVRSSAFETRLNDSRTGLNLPVRTIEQIVSEISRIIEGREQDQIQRIKREQATGVDAALRENPILRIGLKGRTVSEYVAVKPNNWSAEEFVSDLAIERFRASSDLTKAITYATQNEADYKKKIEELSARLDANKKEALAEYVLHRKSVIELVEAARRFNKDGGRAPEDVIHDLVFRRFSDSVTTNYFQHNLWLIDDTLAFLPYISSDRTMHGGRRSKGDKVTDIAFFDDSMVLGDNDGTTVTIVEFKKPSRNDYVFGNVKSDPVEQVIETLEQATDNGGITRTDGSHFVFSGVVRRFAYIVADHTTSLVKVLKRHDFKNDWNPKIYRRFRDNEQIFIQAIGYDTLIENAKKRNQAFFSVLLGE